jgi:MFS family permease
VSKGILLVTLTSVFFYMITAYTPTYAQQVLGLSERDSFILTIYVGVANFIWVPLMGAVSDRVGRLPVLMFFSVLIALTAYPVMAWLVSDPSFGRLLTALMWMSFLYGGYQGVMVVTLTEIMPAEVRATGFSLAYSIAQAIFGGFTPAICTYLIYATGNRAVPGLWLAFAAVLSIAGALSLYRNSDLARRPAASAGLA